MTPFNKPYFIGTEIELLKATFASGDVSGNGGMTKKCHAYFEKSWGFGKCLFTASCTHALEMCALLLNLAPGDEVIVPSYTFVSSALAFVREGAKPVFVDSREDHPGMDENAIEAAITAKTRAIIVVHYAGVACDMDKIMAIAERHGLIVIEDAAHAIDSFYKGRALGSIGHFGCFSFHETKNIHCGEGGMLIINDDTYADRAEILWEKGTNRSQFYRGEVDKYGWVDTGSSFLGSDISATFLYAQLLALDEIQNQRKALWSNYHTAFLQRELPPQIQLPGIPEYATCNAHNYYLRLESTEQRSELIQRLKETGYMAVFHYLALHQSEYYLRHYPYKQLKMAECYESTLLRFPLHHAVTSEDVENIVDVVAQTLESS